jgi:prophage regulatory protein
MTKRLLVRARELPKIIGFSTSHCYRLLAAGKFPAPVRIGPRTSGWKMEDLENWVKEQQPDPIDTSRLVNGKRARRKAAVEPNTAT